MSESSADPSLAAIIVCGGRSVRMGRDKASLMFGDETLLQRVCRLTRAAAKPIVVVAAFDQELSTLPTEIQVVRDVVPDTGPLAGVLTGLLELSRLPPSDSAADSAVWVGACDSPFVNPLVIREMHRQLLANSGADVALVRHADRRHPLHAVYCRSVLPVVQQLLDSDERRMMALLQHLEVHEVPLGDLEALDPGLQCLKNVNTPADLRDARDCLTEPRKVKK